MAFIFYVRPSHQMSGYIYLFIFKKGELQSRLEAKPMGGVDQQASSLQSELAGPFFGVVEVELISSIDQEFCH